MYTASEVPNTCVAPPPFTIPQLMLPGLPPPLYLPPPSSAVTSLLDVKHLRYYDADIFYDDCTSSKDKVWRVYDIHQPLRKMDLPSFKQVMISESNAKYLYNINSELKQRYDSYRGNFPLLSTGGAYVTFKGRQIPLNKSRECPTASLAPNETVQYVY